MNLWKLSPVGTCWIVKKVMLSEDTEVLREKKYRLSKPVTIIRNHLTR